MADKNLVLRELDKVLDKLLNMSLFLCVVDLDTLEAEVLSPDFSSGSHDFPNNGVKNMIVRGLRYCCPRF